MRRPLLILLASLGLGRAVAAAPDEDALRALVHSFIADYEAWNDTAQRQSDKAPLRSKAAQDAMEAAERAYAQLIGTYCPPGYRHQGISFGSEAMHRTADEKILGVDTKGRSSVVRTRLAQFSSGVDISSQYEYHFEKAQGGRWYLVRLLVLVGKEKLEAL
ncbi:hypothetical protein PMI14_05711 [Acidovorax sp. CF316]|uniref:hypothetical protein n=1 Tax=Acidovorax sp. CF316 TaxID=1144317 RepID=UPI00026BEF29|nr:hypothetical protein [Acidovorax sp. CF316]EJE49706.1 hypothetical protein PMI14_05711 [Acidovorax sp. CF316]